MFLPAPTPLERLRGTFFRAKRSLDDFSNRTFLRTKHARKAAGWDARIADILASPDTALLPRVPNAGLVRGQTQVMHNGLLVAKDCYYRWRGTRLFTATRGVHEPQEERVFSEVLKHIRTGGTMIELGAYWAFYSMWFAREISAARCLMVEPLLTNLDLGRRNFRLNRLDGEFIRGFVGSQNNREGRTLTVCVDDLVEQRGFDQIDILHSDIQGFEDQMLRGAERTLRARKVRFTASSLANSAPPTAPSPSPSPAAPDRQTEKPRTDTIELKFRVVHAPDWTTLPPGSSFVCIRVHSWLKKIVPAHSPRFPNSTGNGFRSLNPRWCQYG